MLEYLNDIFRKPKRKEDKKFRKSKVLICKGITKKARPIEIFRRRSFSKNKDSIEDTLGKDCVVILNVSKACPNCDPNDGVVEDDAGLKRNKRESVSCGNSWECQREYICVQFDSKESFGENKNKDNSELSCCNLEGKREKTDINVFAVNSNNMNKPTGAHGRLDTIKDQYISGLKLKDNELNDIKVTVEKIKRLTGEQRLARNIFDIKNICFLENSGSHKSTNSSQQTTDLSKETIDIQTNTSQENVRVTNELNDFEKRMENLRVIACEKSTSSCEQNLSKETIDIQTNTSEENIILTNGQNNSEKRREDLPIIACEKSTSSCDQTINLIKETIDVQTNTSEANVITDNEQTNVEKKKSVSAKKSKNSESNTIANNRSKKTSQDSMTALSFKSATSECLISNEKCDKLRSSLSYDEILKKISQSKLASEEDYVPLVRTFDTNTTLEFDSKFRLHSKIYLTSSEKELYSLDFI